MASTDATAYNIQFSNATKTAYHFAVYQTFPNSPGLKSVAWQVRGVPPAGAIPATASVDWILRYGVSICDFDADSNKFTGKQIVDAELGKKYQAILEDKDIPTIDPNPAGSTGSPSEVKLKNATHQPIDMGFTINNSLVAAQTAKPGETANFVVHPTYYVALYRNIELGQLVDSDVEVGPVEVKFVDGYTKCNVEARLIAGDVQLTAKLVP